MPVLSTTPKTQAPAPSRSGQRRLAAALLLTPALVTSAVLAIVPIALVARSSLSVSDDYGVPSGGWTLANYAALFDPIYLKVMGYSLTMAAITTVLSLAIGYLVSVYLVSRPPRRQALALVAIIVPFWTDFLVRTLAWITLLGREGPIQAALGALGIDSVTLVPSSGAVILGLLYAFLPTAIFPIYTAMRGIEPSVREAALDLGCSWWTLHRRVIAPLSASGIGAAALLTFVPVLGVFVIPVLLGGGKNQLIGNVIVTLYTEFRDQPVGAAAAMVLLALLLLSLLLAATLNRRTARRTASWTE